MALVIAYGAGSLVVHHQFHTLCVGILVEHVYVEIGIRGDEIKHIVFGVAKPVFPAYIPTLDKHLVKAMLGSEVDILLHILVVCRMAAMGLGL